jgi:hypothetical protein
MPIEISSRGRARGRFHLASGTPFGIKEHRVGIRNDYVAENRQFVWVGLARGAVELDSRNLFGERQFVWV